MRRHVVDLVLHYLGAVLLVTVLGVLVLTYRGVDVPGVLNDTVDIVVIAMVGLLSIGPKQAPQQVEVTNSAADPVPTTAAEPVDSDTELP